MNGVSKLIAKEIICILINSESTTVIVKSILHMAEGE